MSDPVRTAFILPAKGDTPRMPAYQQIGGFFSQRDIVSVGAAIDWTGGKLPDYLDMARAGITPQLDRLRPDEVILFGADVGALLAMVLAAEVDASALVLCGPPALFTEEREAAPPWEKLFGGGDTLPAPATLPAQPVLLYPPGALPPRVRQSRAQRYPHAQVIEVTGRKLADPAYLAAAASVILRL
ncbi:MAG: hypothetical protein ACFB51_07335 [Anaerolineae bacterium]